MFSNNVTQCSWLQFVFQNITLSATKYQNGHILVEKEQMLQPIWNLQARERYILAGNQ